MKLREIRCSNCMAFISPEDINRNQGYAVCSYCGAVFAITEDAAHTRPRRYEVPMSEKVQLDSTQGFSITRKWFSLKSVFLIVFAVFWNTFMVFWHGIAISSGMYIMSLFGLIHTAVGVGVTYAAIALIVNKSVIQIQQGLLSVKHGPLFWPGIKGIHVDDVEQLYCVRKRHSNKGNVYYRYTVRILLHSGKNIKLIGGLPEADQAIYIE